MDCDKEVSNDRKPSNRADRKATADKKNAVTVRAARIRKPIPVVKTSNLERIVKPREASGSDSSPFPFGASVLIPKSSTVISRVQLLDRHGLTLLDLRQKDLMICLAHVWTKANAKHLKIHVQIFQ